MYFSTARDMASLDDAAVRAGLEIRQMMELAGWHMVELFRELGLLPPRRVSICAGRGNKAGDGLAAARHLANHGYSPGVILAAPESELKPDPLHHLRLLKEMGIPIAAYGEEDRARELLSADVLIDALIGYRLSGAPRGAFASLIREMNTHSLVIAYDIPSGVDATTGECFDPHVRARSTLTLALPKKAFLSKTGKAAAGDVYLADIGIPKKLYDALAEGSRPDFGGRLLKLDPEAAST